MMALTYELNVELCFNCGSTIGCREQLSTELKFEGLNWVITNQFGLPLSKFYNP